MNKRVILKRFPHIKQSENSSCCGPYSIWMLNEYLGSRGTISPQSLIKMCRSSKEWGTENEDLVEVLEKLGYKVEEIPLKDRIQNIRTIRKTIDSKRPLLALVQITYDLAHWCVIKGYTDNALIFSDSYYGKNAVRYIHELYDRMLNVYKIGSKNGR